MLVQTNIELLILKVLQLLPQIKFYACLDLNAMCSAICFNYIISIKHKDSIYPYNNTACM